MKLRSNLDEIDREILNLLMKRTEIVRRVGSIKKQRDIPIVDEEREETVYCNVAKFASKNDIDSHQIKSIFREIMLLSRKVQNEIFKQD